MAWFIDVGTPYYRQEEPDFCGGAVAQMILASIGAGRIDQTCLFESNNSHSTGEMGTSPGGLKYTLNKRKPPAFEGEFNVVCAGSEEEGSANILRTLFHFGVTTGTLVVGCVHWVAVRGAKTNVDPARHDAKVSIEGFYINNPWPPTAPASGVPDGRIPRGFSNEYVARAEWKKTYLTGCRALGGGHRRFVSVCDSRSPPPLHIEPAAHVPTGTGNRLISVDEAVATANRGLTRHLRSNPVCPMTSALRGARAVSAQLVRRLDLPGEFYHLILLHRGGAPSAVVRGDGFHGGVLGAGSLDGVTHEPIIAPEAALAAARQALLDPGDGRARIVSGDGAFHIEPTLVWRPCQESRSPYYPFHEITVGSDTVYVGHDGTVYPILHDLG